MTARRNSLFVAAMVALAVLVAPAAAKAPFHPKTGTYKASTSAAGNFKFRIVKAVCPPNVRGGNQHQRKGYCFDPNRAAPLIVETCPSGFVYHDIYAGLFATLLNSKGKLALPESRSDGATGKFKITVDTHGHATGSLEQTVPHATDAGVVEKCPSGRITFTAHR